MAALVQALSRGVAAMTPETLRPQPGGPPLAAPTLNAAPNPAASDDAHLTLPARPDIHFAPPPPVDWHFDEPPPRRDDNAPAETLTAEADLSQLGLFRLETRAVAGGFSVVVRHAAPLDDGGLESIGDAVAEEAARYGVRARIRFAFDPALRAAG